MGKIPVFLRRALQQTAQTARSARVPRPSVKAVLAANTAPAQHAARLLPERFQLPAKRLLTGGSLAVTGAGLYSGYNAAGTAAAESARSAAEAAGVTDPTVLQEVATRGRQKMLPLAYAALAPKWLGGDGTPAGKQLANAVGTVAYHNLGPAIVQPSPAVAARPIWQKALYGLVSNPAVTAANTTLPPRPSAAELWKNTPEAARNELLKALATAHAAPATTNSVAKHLAHVFEPAVAHQQRRLQQFGQQVGSALSQFGGAARP
jgi:hypothetical protein